MARASRKEAGASWGACFGADRSGAFKAAVALSVVLWASGCGSVIPVIRAEPQSFAVHDAGSSDGVRVLVEKVTYLGDRRGTVVVNLAIENRSPQEVRFESAANRLELEDRIVTARESQVLVLRPGATERVRLSFQTYHAGEDLTSATLHLEGVEVASGLRTVHKVRLVAERP